MHPSKGPSDRIVGKILSPSVSGSLYPLG